ncbi:MAG: ribosome biogenesis GTPase Der [Balneolales bacterium]
MLPVVAIVGRPNVGKSTFFNRLIGERQAIVHDQTGVTRDRHYGESYWNNRDFTVIDTGGYLPEKGNVIVDGIREQIELAILEADVIIFLVDVEQGITDLDQAVANILRKQNKPVVVVANKADNTERSWQASEFYKLGYDDIFALSAITGTGTGELLDHLVTLLPEDTKDEENNGIPKIAIIGRPNVGKSSLVNALLNDERSIVTDIAGTTRDSINSTLTFHNKSYTLVDTAGLRRKSKVAENIEFYSAVRTAKSIRECNVAILLIDAVQGFEAQDLRILREAEKFNKGVIVAINKWDLIEKDTGSVKEYEKKIRDKMPNMGYIPIITISAVSRQRIFKIIEMADIVIEQRHKKISTSGLNKFMERIITDRPLPGAGGKERKIKYVTQVKSNPPVFMFFLNNPEDLPANYRRFIENRMREEFHFTGVPITLIFKEK